jgi:hypothetical protein
MSISLDFKDLAHVRSSHCHLVNSINLLCFRAGYKVTVIDTSDQDWWKGKCLGRIGYFPSKYVIKLQPGERPLQVTHNLQVSDGDNGLTLLRDQVSPVTYGCKYAITAAPLIIGNSLFEQCCVVK